MADLEYPSGAGITVRTNTDLESADMTFVGTATGSGTAYQTDYTDIRDAITANPGGSVGSGTAATGLNVSGSSDLDGAVVINESGADLDTRVEGDTDVNLIFANAGEDRVGIGTATPATKLDVSGGIRQERAYFEDEIWTALSSEWTAQASDGSLSYPTSDNGWARYTTNGVATNTLSYDWNDKVRFKSTKRPTFEIRLMLGQTEDTEIKVGLIEASGGGDNDYIFIKYDYSSSANWTLECSTGGSSTSDSGVAASLSEVTFRFEFNSDTEIEWFADGASQGTVSSNVPTVALQPIISVATEAGSPTSCDFDYIKIWQDRT
jgi:hypothetical protein